MPHTHGSTRRITLLDRVPHRTPRSPPGARARARAPAIACILMGFGSPGAEPARRHHQPPRCGYGYGDYGRRRAAAPRRHSAPGRRGVCKGGGGEAGPGEAAGRGARAACERREVGGKRGARAGARRRVRSTAAALSGAGVGRVGGARACMRASGCRSGTRPRVWGLGDQRTRCEPRSRRRGARARTRGARLL